MKTLSLGFVFGLIVFFSTQLCASDLELTIRPHTRQILFGDPLYIQASIINRGKAAVFGPRPTYELGTIRFEIRDPETDLIIWHGGRRGFGDEGEPERFDPDQPVKYYWHLFLPGLPRLDDAFWKPIRKGRTLYICGVYRLHPSRVEVRSDWHEVRVAARDEGELRSLVFFMPTEDRSTKGPGVSSFGVLLGQRINRQQTLDLSSKIKPGELLDLFQLAIRMQEIYATPKDSRQESDAGLVAVLEKFPNIKRQALTKQARSVAEAHNMRTTMAALDAIRMEGITRPDD